MNIPSASIASLVALSIATVLSSTPVIAQQQPITGQMMGQGSSVSAAPAPVADPPPAPRRYATAATVNPVPTPAAQTPMVTAEVSPPAAPPSSSPSRSHGTPVGETTRTLLQMQADGGQAGRPLPMLGAEASASYARYLKSFNHDIPEFYKTTVGKSGGDTGGSER